MKKLTLIGLLLVLIPHMIIILLFPDSLTGNMPVWLLVTLGVTHLLYIVKFL